MQTTPSHHRKFILHLGGGIESGLNKLGATLDHLTSGNNLETAVSKLTDRLLTDPFALIEELLNGAANDVVAATQSPEAAGELAFTIGLTYLTQGTYRSFQGVGAASKGGSNYLYHYTSKEAAEAISQQGLKVGRDGFSYLTNKGGLSPLQAQIELALPANRALPTSILRIDASGLNPALIRRVSGNLPGYGAGGGTEFLFNQHIPANLIKVIK